MKPFLRIPLNVLAKLLCKACLTKLSLIKVDEKGEVNGIELCAECEIKTKNWIDG